MSAMKTRKTSPKSLTPTQAVDALVRLHDQATGSLRQALDAYARNRKTPTAKQRAGFCYPELRATYHFDGEPHPSPRAFAKFQTSGTFTTTITQPGAFRAYLEEQLTLLVDDYAAVLEVVPGSQPIPYAFVLEGGNELTQGGVNANELAQYFPVPMLSQFGDEIADGTYVTHAGTHPPLALFDAMRTDFSLKRLLHYTGTDWRTIQPWILLTNYQRYMDVFVQWSVQHIRQGKRYTHLILPGGHVLDKKSTDADVAHVMELTAKARFQMPAYNLVAKDGNGISIVNIGVGPSNAKTITDHLAVLRPHCWLMVGHCGGLRQSQRIGDYVLAHAYLREDHVLDSILPPEIPIPALAEVQMALQEAAADITGERGAALKARLRTGTVVTEDDRNWELRWSQESQRMKLSRAIAIDMESGTIAAQGFRFRVPYGTLLCVSDKPLHGEIKLPGAANAFYERSVAQHLQIGIQALERLRLDMTGLHSRKLRSFDEPPLR
jgi:AMP nucleosidase